ncbi:GNAT family N-acetyltransferase [Liquorilactobacillus capillatus]|uniref:Acetyltransferase n=1 Tax=Liquorilactobacillus capillatus DSM 19910 TaxID=1423731 RepID=A0A0R1LZP6_9LACO|nr:GNAT family N-acetyltransferase [Liquorilactobacillus capillatus]KRL01206.1 acetyltransferase [Liquorilactobacillus capillatus DSM 19910]
MVVKFIRKAVAADIEKIMPLIEKAKVLLASENIPQWQNGYPNYDVITADINQGATYILIVDGKITGTATLAVGDEPNYQKLYFGSWKQFPNKEAYAVIHRIAIDPQYKGSHLADFFFSSLNTIAYQLGVKQLRVDTHILNKRMQHIIIKAGFNYTGVVYMQDDPQEQRNVYQLFLPA